jgi:hypothetical protein
LAQHLNREAELTLGSKGWVTGQAFSDKPSGKVLQGRFSISEQELCQLLILLGNADQTAPQ